jgi:hypothetical protein
MNENKNLPGVAIIMSAIAIVAVAVGVRVVTSKMDTIAALQYGGAENYKLAKKLFTSEKFIAQQAQ